MKRAVDEQRIISLHDVFARQLFGATGICRVPDGIGSRRRWRMPRSSFPDREERVLGGFETTNQRMELLAAITALESLREPHEVVLFTDCRPRGRLFRVCRSGVGAGGASEWWPSATFTSGSACSPWSAIQSDRMDSHPVRAYPNQPTASPGEARYIASASGRRQFARRRWAPRIQSSHRLVGAEQPPAVCGHAFEFVFACGLKVKPRRADEILDGLVLEDRRGSASGCARAVAIRSRGRTTLSRI